MTDPSSTLRLFQHDRVAEGYALARPFLHPQVFALLRDLIRPVAPFRRALDVGCGTGMSSLALLELAREVVGVDGSQEMLRRARHADAISYVGGLAENLPFAGCSFDIVVACGCIDWVDRARFLPGAASLLEAGGWLVPLDFGDSGRSADLPCLQKWYRDVFLRDFPRPASADPIIRPEEALGHGFSAPVTHHFRVPCRFGAEQYGDFLLTESCVVAAVEHGRQSPTDVKMRLMSDLAPLFGGKECDLEFGGYIQLLRRL